MAFSISSPEFADGDAIPRRYTCDGQDVSPELVWTAPPPGALSLALVMDDPDAPAGTFTHWLAWGIAGGPGRLREGEPAPIEGRNDFGTLGYRGPCPPRGHGPHRYRFRLHALNTPDIGLPPGAGRRAVDLALSGHVLAVAQVVGMFAR
jgi:Raf kinase inhibitor-like YbhB/YbcL family protein